jgi:hypothetical protein
MTINPENAAELERLRKEHIEAANRASAGLAQRVWNRPSS